MRLGIGLSIWRFCLGPLDNSQLTQAKGIRQNVAVDNTSSSRMRGDYAVLTLFDGDFDAIAILMSDIEIMNRS
jgi:hypothetical protein